MDSELSKSEAVFMIFMALAAAGYHDPTIKRSSVLMLFAAMLLFNLIHLTVLRPRISERPIVRLSVFVNAFFISLVIYFTRRGESYFWVLYFLPIFTASLALPRREVLWTVAACCAALAAISADSWMAWAWALELGLATKCATLLLAGVITMRSAQGERQARRQLAFEQERQQRERQELSERLGHAERLATLGTLVASVAHEVGGPLTAILGICELRASDPPGSPQDYREDLQLIERSTQRCKAVLDSVRSFSRKRQIEPTSNDFNALIKQCAMLKKYDWVGKIELCEDYAQGLPEITMIPTEFQQVVFNLLTNAQEAILSAKDSGRIWIRTERAGEGVRVLIEDDGPGIPPETLPHIFDAFFTTKPAGQGTGLGLSIVKQLVDHQGGTVSAGQRPGGGARFSVQLPLIPARDTMRRTLVPPPLHGLSA